MLNFTSNTYQMEREILTFYSKIFRKLSRPERKFVADMNYGILASGSFLPTRAIMVCRISKVVPAGRTYADISLTQSQEESNMITSGFRKMKRRESYNPVLFWLYFLLFLI